MSVEFPRCVVCRVRIEPGENVVFRPDARVRHLQCPPVVCPVCSRDILPGTPIRRDGEALLHGSCWLRRYRVRAATAAGEPDRRALVGVRLAAGAMPSGEPEKTWNGTSAGGVCAGCGAAIDAGQPEYVMQFANTGAFRLHRACYVVWEHERGRRHEIAGGSGASPWTTMFELGAARRAGGERACRDELLWAAAETRREAARTRAAARAARAACASLRRGGRPACS